MVNISKETKTLITMAHDLKAPLSSIQNLLDIIDKGYVDDVTKIKELVSRANKKTGTLLKMLDDILDYALLETQSAIKFEHLNIESLIIESLSIMKPLASKKNISFHFNPDLCPQKRVEGNYTFLLRAINNVISNAIKYNREKGEIKIYCAEHPLEKALVINIEDTGKGITKEDLKNTFKIFQRGKDANKESDSGIGLGLALVKQIVELHKGSVEITSTLGKGTTVSIKIPLIK